MPAAAAAAAAGGGMSFGAKAGIGALIGGSVVQAVAQNQAAKDAQKLHEANAAMIKAESEREAREHGEEAGRKRAEKARLAAMQNVQFVKSGVKAGTGTALL